MGEKPRPEHACPSCGEWLRVELLPYSETIDGVVITGDAVPCLACEACGHRARTRFVSDRARAEASAAKRLNQEARAMKFEDRRFDLCGDVTFQYSSLDWEAIPAVRQSDLEIDGYYAPVFFEPKVLVKYMMLDEYAVNYFEAGGRIRFPNGFDLEYGINRNGKVLCWLGDIDKIPEKERYYLRSENVPSDHDVVSGLYKRSRLGVAAGKTREQELTRAIRVLVGTSRDALGCDFHEQSEETLKISHSLARPVVWDRTVMLAINDLFKLCVESFDRKFLKREIKSMGAKVDFQVGLLCLLQEWLELRFKADASDVVRPFYVLRSWRNALDHRWSAKSSRSLDECYELMNLEGGERTRENLYGRVIEGLIVSFGRLAEMIAGMPPVAGADGTREGAQESTAQDPED